MPWKKLEILKSSSFILIEWEKNQGITKQIERTVTWEYIEWVEETEKRIKVEKNKVSPTQCSQRIYYY